MSASPELTAELLAKPAPHAVRLIAVARLADVSAKYDKLWAGDEDHIRDLRVALRRLRSWLRAYRPELDDTLRRKTRRRLRKLADVTNSARDAEVALEWIGTQNDLSPRERAGARYMTERLQRELDAARAAMQKTLEADLPKLLATLSDELGEYWLHNTLEEAQTPRDMSSVTRDVLQRHGERLARAIERIESKTDFEAAHRARIAAKRLRYLLETLNGDTDAAAMIARLRSLQDMLGVVHDSHRVADRLVREVGERAAQDARLAALASMGLKKAKESEAPDAPAFAKIRPGIVALAQRAHAREQKAFGLFKRRWRKRQIESTVADVGAIADSVTAE